MIQVDDLCFKAGKREILHNISLHVQGNRFISIIGPNGAGKSTLLKCIAGVSRYSAGRVHFFNQLEQTLTRQERAKMIGYVPQHFQQSFPMQVDEYVLLGRKPYIKWSVQKQDEQMVDKTLAYMRLSHLRNRYVDELSGGERQRVAIARALVQEPKILMLDEPISALDINHQIQVLKALKELAKQGHLVLVVLHDLELAARFSDDIILMHEGKIHSTGAPVDVLTAANLKDVYSVDAKVSQHQDGLSIYVVDIEEEVMS